MNHSVSIILLFLTLALPLQSAQDTILLNSDELLSGHIQGMQANFVILEIQNTTGQGTRRISPKNIKTLTLFDTPDPGTIPTIQLLEPLATRRAALLDILQEQDEQILIDLLDLYIESGRALEALSYAKLWHPKIQYNAHAKRIEEQLIRAAIAADLPDEALVHAHNYIKIHPLSNSALAYHTIAESLLNQGDTEEALWTALIPIAFQQSQPQPHLIRCYAIAIACSAGLNDIPYAQVLEAEMNNLINQFPRSIRKPITPIPTTTPPSLRLETLSFESLLKSNPLTQ